jgi:hypothetical protein
MGKINFARVLIGGLVAGLILNIGEWVLNGMILAKEMKDFFQKCGFPEPGTNLLIIAVLITFVAGIVLVLIYAAIRPRFGPGPKTAIIAALFVWFGVYVYQTVISVGLGMVPPKVAVIALAWGLVEYILAALAGGALYQEA